MAGWNRGFGQGQNNRNDGRQERRQDRRDLRQDRRQDRRAAGQLPPTAPPAAPNSGAIDPASNTLPEPSAPPIARPNTPPAGGWNQGGWQNPFFNPNSDYGGTFAPGQFAQTGVADFAIGKNPELAYTRRLGELGIDPLSAKGQNLRGQWGQLLEGYNAATLTNPNLKIQEYLAGIDLNALYNAQTAQQRGENPGRFAPRARTISRGYGG